MAGRPFHAARLDAVEAALASMESHASIGERLSKEWGVGRKVVRRYITEVQRLWNERAASTTVEDRRNQLSEMTLDLYREARRMKHARVALQCVDQLAKLHGITTVSVLGAVTYDPQGALTSPQAITARLRELKALQAGTDDDPEDSGGTGSIN